MSIQIQVSNLFKIEIRNDFNIWNNEWFAILFFKIGKR